MLNDLSPHRKEKVINIEKSNIQFPDQLMPVETALDSLIDPKNKILLAAGIDPTNADQPEANLFHVIFGRDALIQLRIINSARDFIKNSSTELLKQKMLLDLTETLNETTILYLASLQGTKINVFSEEEIGKIAHEIRNSDDKIAIELNQERGWEWPYYGSIDATIEYTMAIITEYKINSDFLKQEYISKDGIKRNIEHSLLEAIKCILKWGKNGLIEYKRMNSKGIEIQSWRDSFDAISSYIGGDLPDFNKPVALLDLQVLAFNVLSEILLTESLFDSEQLEQLEQLQILKPDIKKLLNNLEKNIFEHFWIETPEGGYFAQAIQWSSDKDELKEEPKIFDAISSSNLVMLNSHLLKNKSDYQTKIFSTVYDKLQTQHGIRTLSSDSNRFHNCGYHTGNIWLFDTALCAFGLYETGYTEEAKSLFQSVINICHETRMYPELVGGDGYNTESVIVYDEVDKCENKIKQPGQTIQGWSVSAYWLAQNALIGIKKSTTINLQCVGLKLC